MSKRLESVGQLVLASETSDLKVENDLTLDNNLTINGNSNLNGITTVSELKFKRQVIETASNMTLTDAHSGIIWKINGTGNNRLCTLPPGTAGTVFYFTAGSGATGTYTIQAPSGSHVLFDLAKVTDMSTRYTSSHSTYRGVKYDQDASVYAFIFLKFECFRTNIYLCTGTITTTNTSFIDY